MVYAISGMGSCYVWHRSPRHKKEGKGAQASCYVEQGRVGGGRGLIERQIGGQDVTAERRSDVTAKNQVNPPLAQQPQQLYMGRKEPKPLGTKAFTLVVQILRRHQFWVGWRSEQHSG